MACRGGCGGKGKSSTMRTMKTVRVNDEDYILAVYTHRNRGQHPVFGPEPEKRSYGYRSGGERFYVHRDDVARSMFFEAVPEDKPAPVQQPVVTPPPPEIISIVESDVKIIDFTEEAIEKAIVSAKGMGFTIDELPGITPVIKKGMTEAGLTTPEKIFNAGIVGLTKIKYIGKQRASSFLEYIKENHGLS